VVCGTGRALIDEGGGVHGGAGGQRKGIMGWKTSYRSFYYETMPDLPEVVLPRAGTGLLVIDVQNVYLQDDPSLARTPAEQVEFARWQPFFRRMRGIVIPSIQRLLTAFRAGGMPVFYARIACLTPDGADRSLSQRRPGFNNLLLPFRESPSQILAELEPRPDEVVVCKTTDSALTGTNLRLILANMAVRNVVVCGIFTDQCVSSTVRSLADESFNVVIADDGCAAGTDDLHRQELAILNNIYAQVLSPDEILGVLGKG
jgi:nicotinamidase-related amidase